MKILSYLIMTLVFSLFLLNCGPKSKSPNDSQLLSKVGANCELTLDLISACVQADFESLPKSNEPFSFGFRIKDKSGVGIDIIAPYQLTVEPYMTKMGHGTNSVPTVKRIGFGVFQAEGLKFSMPGPWDVRIQIRDASRNLLDQTHFEILVR